MCRVRCENTDVGCITRRIPSPILTIFCSDRGLNRPRRTLLCITTAMYIATFACWIAMLVGQFKTLHNIKNGLTNAYNWLPPSECFSWQPVENIPKYCTILLTPNPSPSDLEWPSTEECIGTITLSFNVSFSFLFAPLGISMHLFTRPHRSSLEMLSYGGGCGSYGAGNAMYSYPVALSYLLH